MTFRRIIKNKNSGARPLSQTAFSLYRELCRRQSELITAFDSIQRPSWTREQGRIDRESLEFVPGAFLAGGGYRGARGGDWNAR